MRRTSAGTHAPFGRGRHGTKRHLQGLLGFVAAALVMAQATAMERTEVNSMTSAYVCTSDLTLALQAASPELAQRSSEVARREGELRLVELGVSTVVSVTTGVDVGANLLREQETAWSGSLQMDAGLGYRYDEVAIIRARTALTTAIKREADQKRADVLSALISLSRLRAAERLAQQSAASAAEAESLAASVRLSTLAAQAHSQEHATGPAPTELAPDLALNVRELDLAAAKARATAAGRADEVGAALAELARLGLHTGGALSAPPTTRLQGPVACLSEDLVPLSRAGGPELPAPALHGSSERALLQAAVNLTTAQHRRAALEPLRDLSLTAHYQEGGARVLAEVKLDGGRPAAGVNLRVREAAARNWGVGVAATIRLDDTMGAALATAAAQVEAAHAALHDYDAAFPVRVSAGVAGVETTWLQLAFAVEAVSIARGRLALAAEERDVTRAEQVLSRSIEALEREYQAYLRALGRYLNEFDLPWSALVAN